MTPPEQLRRSLTWDQGEMAQHARLRFDTGLQFFAIRTALGSAAPTRTPTGCCASISAGTNLSEHTRGDLDAVAAALNNRPCKTLGWRTQPAS